MRSWDARACFGSRDPEGNLNSSGLTMLPGAGIGGEVPPPEESLPRAPVLAVNILEDRRGRGRKRQAARCAKTPKTRQKLAAAEGARGETFSDSVLLANRCFRPPKSLFDGVRIYRTYRPLNGQSSLPKWPNDGSSHTFGRNRESRSREATRRRSWPRAVHYKKNARQKKGVCRNQ
jgi:hypothetical protein